LQRPTQKGEGLNADELQETDLQDQAALKQESVAKFMDKMQGQLGVPADRIIQAFAAMDSKTLMGSPEDATSAFVDNLKLAPGQKNQAAQLYKQLVNETGESALNEKLGEGQPVSFKVLDAAQVQLQRLNESINGLNDSFFRKGEPGAQMQNDPQLKEWLNAKMNAGKTPRDNSQDDLALAGLAAGSNPTQANAAYAAAAAGARALSSTALEGDEDTSEVSKPSAGTSGLSALAMAGGAGSALALSEGDAASSEQSGNSSNSKSQQQMSANIGAQKLSQGNALNPDAAKSIKKFSLGDAAGGDKSSIINGNSATAGAAGAQAPAAGSTAAALTPAAMMSTGPQPTEQEEAENVKEIMKQAQIIMKKGGGEMTVQMKPEGMGHVNLKVSVENGQVQVQMITQNDKVKNMLENGLHELKSSLAAHKLSLESMKIGVQDTSAEKKMDQHQQDAQREAQREFASGFMGQMRDERQNMRQGFFDNPGWRAYKREPGDRVKLGPANAAAAAAQESISARRDDSSRRLNLVA
jgi:flagellar hook-length control protein FliK